MGFMVCFYCHNRITSAVKSSGRLRQRLYNVAYNAKKDALEKGKRHSALLINSSVPGTVSSCQNRQMCVYLPLDLTCTHNHLLQSGCCSCCNISIYSCCYSLVFWALFWVGVFMNSKITIHGFLFFFQGRLHHPFGIGWFLTR